jgi:hypothetical protein
MGQGSYGGPMTVNVDDLISIFTQGGERGTTPNVKPKNTPAIGA